MLKGMLVASNVMLIAKCKKFIGADQKEYYYEISFLKKGSDDVSDEIITCTSGHLFDSKNTFETYNVGFSYSDKKLRVVDCQLVNNNKEVKSNG